jgi:hypothetical protein
MNKTVKVVADIGDRVKVPALELREAVIRAILLDPEGVQYQIGYFDKGDRKTAYVFGDEIEANTKGP